MVGAPCKLKCARTKKEAQIIVTTPLDTLGHLLCDLTVFRLSCVRGCQALLYGERRPFKGLVRVSQSFESKFPVQRSLTT